MDILARRDSAEYFELVKLVGNGTYEQQFYFWSEKRRKLRREGKHGDAKVREKEKKGRRFSRHQSRDSSASCSEDYDETNCPSVIH